MCKTISTVLSVALRVNIFLHAYALFYTEALSAHTGRTPYAGGNLTGNKRTQHSNSRKLIRRHSLKFCLDSMKIKELPLQWAPHQEWIVYYSRSLMNSTPTLGGSACLDSTVDSFIFRVKSKIYTYRIIQQRIMSLNVFIRNLQICC